MSLHVENAELDRFVAEVVAAKGEREMEAIRQATLDRQARLALPSSGRTSPTFPRGYGA